MSVKPKLIAAQLARLKAIELVPLEIVELLRGARIGPHDANAADMELPRAAENIVLHSSYNTREAVQRTRKNLLALAPADSAENESILL